MNPLWIPLLAVLLVGIPHGALDAILIRKVSGSRSTLWFYGSYLLLCLAVIAIWFQAPVVSLAVFLMISLWHFGGADARGYGENSWLSRIVHGAMIPIVLPALQPEAVTPLFQLVALENQTPFVDWAQNLIGVWAGLVLLKFFRQEFQLREFLELAGLCLFFWLADPLYSFALYFCGLHSVRHFQQSFRYLSRNHFGKRELIEFATLSGIPVLMILLGGSLMNGTDWIQGLTGAVFIGLAALTVPHMILIDGWVPLGKTRPDHST